MQVVPVARPHIRHTTCPPLEVHLGTLDRVFEARRRRLLELQRAYAELAAALPAIG